MKPLSGILFAILSIALVTAPSASAQSSHDDIVEVAAGAGTFETLVAAVTAADLVETLKGDGPFTVFAPTDEAFARLPEGTVEDLLKPENKQTLIDILTYHVVPGRVTSSDLLKMTSATTVNGEAAPIGLRIGDANVVTADIMASNGVIHVIDKVLIP